MSTKWQDCIFIPFENGLGSDAEIDALHCRLESSSLYIPIEQIANLATFVHLQILNSKSFKALSFSLFLKGGISYCFVCNIHV